MLSQNSKEVVVLFPGGAMQAEEMQRPIVAGKYATKSLQHIFCLALRFSSDGSLLAVGLPALCSRHRTNVCANDVTLNLD